VGINAGQTEEVIVPAKNRKPTQSILAVNKNEGVCKKERMTYSRIPSKGGEIGGKINGGVLPWRGGDYRKPGKKNYSSQRTSLLRTTFLKKKTTELGCCGDEIIVVQGTGIGQI